MDERETDMRVFSLMLGDFEFHGTFTSEANAHTAANQWAYDIDALPIQWKGTRCYSDKFGLIGQLHESTLDEGVTTEEYTDPAMVMVIEPDTDIRVHHLDDMYELVIETGGTKIVLLFDETGPVENRIWNFPDLIEGALQGGDISDDGAEYDPNAPTIAG